MKEKMTITMYILSTFLVTFSVGVFSLIFNMHIVESINSKTFLSNFLLLGNISMAIGGVLLGKIIDKYDKRKVLFCFTFLAAVCFALECHSTKISHLYLLSVGYGICYSVLMSIHMPFLLENTQEERQTFVISLCSAAKLFASTLGVLAGGRAYSILKLYREEHIYGTILKGTSIVYLCSVIPLFFIFKEHKKKQETPIKSIEKKTEEKRGKEFVFIAFAFLIEGLLLFFSPYMNLYFDKRFHLELSQISVIMAFMELIPILTNLILGGLFKYLNDEKGIFVLCMLGVAGYCVLMCSESIMPQIIFLLAVSAISSFLFPQINRYILKQFESEKQGRISGIANFFYNLGDSAGTYLEGIFISNSFFKVPFVASGILYMLLMLCVMKVKRKKEQ